MAELYTANQISGQEESFLSGKILLTYLREIP
jgi:hypothetical protein